MFLANSDSSAHKIRPQKTQLLLIDLFFVLFENIQEIKKVISARERGPKKEESQKVAKSVYPYMNLCFLHVFKIKKYRLSP